MQLIFEHSTASVRTFLLKALQHIEKTFINERPGREQLANRCKFIITELCTNAIKHSGQHKSAFNIYTANNGLIIERSDNGAPFCISLPGDTLAFPLNESFTQATIMEDDINRLSMQRINDYCALFLAEHLAEIEPPPAQQTINEHFGLIIICLSSDRFTYTHNPATGQNTFTACINLPS